MTVRRIVLSMVALLGFAAALANVSVTCMGWTYQPPLPERLAARLRKG